MYFPLSSMVSYILAAKATSTAEHELSSRSLTNHFKADILLPSQLFCTCQDITKSMQNIKSKQSPLLNEPFEKQGCIVLNKTNICQLSPCYNTGQRVL